MRQIFALVQPQLDAVEAAIGRQAEAFDPAVQGYISYVCATSGKRLRPALALLAGGATGDMGEGHQSLAVIIELIHMATLIHEDLATNFDDAEISRGVARAASAVCTGEILQTQRRFDLNLSHADYYRIIEMKTAALFGAAAGLGARLNNAGPEAEEALKVYGLKLGTAYQVYDDLLDLAGDEAQAGKTLGTDLKKGKLTLPILNLLQASENGQRERLTQTILRGEEDDLTALGEQARRGGALAAAARAGQGLIEEGLNRLEILPASSYRQALEDVGRRLDATIGQFGE